MRHIFLRFNYGVEIGARLAYLGHFRRTKDKEIEKIAFDELCHRNSVENILRQYGKKPFFLFNWFFATVGYAIYWLCQVSPIGLLNIVAQLLEIFAIVSYNELARLYPEHRHEFWGMADAESRHEEYFRKLRRE